MTDTRNSSRGTSGPTEVHGMCRRAMCVASLCTDVCALNTSAVETNTQQRDDRLTEDNRLSSYSVQRCT